MIASIKVESGTGFESLILLQFILQVRDENKTFQIDVRIIISQAVFNGILLSTHHTLRIWHGYVLLVIYVAFVAWFVIDYEVVVPMEEKSN